jgi:hypothetical protein
MAQGEGPEFKPQDHKKKKKKKDNTSKKVSSKDYQQGSHQERY